MIRWYRPTATAHAYGTRQYSTWHAIRSSSPAGVVMHCGDRWPREVIDSAHADEVECEIATDPADKCKVCADAVATAPVLAGLRSLRSAPAISTLTTREHGVMSGAFDTSTEDV